MSFKGGIKVILIIILLIANLYFMVWPSMSKYLQQGIIVEVTTEESDGLKAPAITFCASNQKV